MAEKTDKKIDINALGQAMDGTWTGRQTASSGPALMTHSVKAAFMGDDLVKVTFTTVVNMVRDRELKDSTIRYEKEADSVIEAAVKRIAAEYKDLADESIKFKRTKVDTSVEIIDLNQFNAKRSAYFRRVAVFEIS